MQEETARSAIDTFTSAFTALAVQRFVLDIRRHRTDVYLLLNRPVRLLTAPADARALHRPFVAVDDGSVTVMPCGSASVAGWC
jgi:hypothetical protein